MPGTLYRMAGEARQWTRRLLGTPELFRRLTAGRDRGLLTTAPAHPINPRELGRLTYGIGERSLRAGPLTLTDRLVSFPATYTAAGFPRRIAWLTADHAASSSAGLVLAALDVTAQLPPVLNVAVLDRNGRFEVSANIWNEGKVRYERQTWNLALADGALVVEGGDQMEPDLSIVLSALHFIDLVGRSDGIASALMVADQRLAGEYEGAEAAVAAIPTDLAPLGPAIARIASGQDDPLHPVHPLNRLLNLRLATAGTEEAVEAIRGAVSSSFGNAGPAPKWEGTPLALPRVRQLLEGEPDPERRQQILDLSVQDNLRRHRLDGGLFSQIDALNEAAGGDPSGRFANFADYAAHVFLGTTVERIEADVAKVARATQDERAAFLARLREQNGGRPVHEADLDYLIAEMSPPVKLKLARALEAARRFYADLGQDPELHPVLFDLAARQGKFSNIAVVPLSGGAAWITANLDPDAVTLRQLAALVHELFHAWDLRAGSGPVQGAYLLVAKGSVAWREGTSKAFENLVFGDGWLRRYLDPEAKEFPPGSLERIAGIHRAAASTLYLRDAAAGLQELALYRDRDASGRIIPLEERMQTFGRFRDEVLGLTGQSTDEGGFPWVLPHFATYAGKYAAYSHGLGYGRRLVAPLARAIGQGAQEGLLGAGRTIDRVLAHGALMVDDASIARILDQLLE